MTNNQLDLVDQINEQEKIDDTKILKLKMLKYLSRKTSKIEGSIDYITMPRLVILRKRELFHRRLKNVGDQVKKVKFLLIETDKEPVNLNFMMVF